MNIAIPQNKKLILFDGVCNLCNTSVLYVIKRDKRNTFLFAQLQSEIGKQIVNHFEVDSSKTDSILLFDAEKQTLNVKSAAALKIAKALSFPSALLYGFMIVPGFIREFVGDFIAKRRYKWYGKKDSCMIPTPELQSKFLA